MLRSLLVPIMNSQGRSPRYHGSVCYRAVNQSINQLIKRSDRLLPVIQSTNQSITYYWLSLIILINQSINRHHVQWSLQELEKNYKIDLLEGKNRNHPLSQPRTWQISLRAVSAPKQKSVPGTLLLMVAGTTITGIRKSGNVLRASANWRAEW